jgi:hypothetical protein
MAGFFTREYFSLSKTTHDQSSDNHLQEDRTSILQKPLLSPVRGEALAAPPRKLSWQQDGTWDWSAEDRLRYRRRLEIVMLHWSCPVT